MKIISPSRSSDSPHHTSVRVRPRRILIAGLLILAPVALTVYIVVLLFRFMDGIFAPLVARALGAALSQEEPYYVPGLGLISTFVSILLLGWLSTNVVGRALLQAVENLICRIPVAKSVYSATKGILEVLAKDQAEAFQRVVLIEYPKKNIFALAFVTGGAQWGVVDPRASDLLLVFVPTTPNPTSGFLLLVPRTEAVELPISVEEGVRMVISGGMLLPKVEAQQPQLPPTTPDADVAIRRQA